MGEQPFEELQGTVIKTILARRITLGVFAAVALVVVLTSRISCLNPLFYAPFGWFLITFPFQFLVNRQRTVHTLHWVHAWFFMAEIVFVTLFVYLTGGSQWIGNIFYLFTVIYANFFLPPSTGVPYYRARHPALLPRCSPGVRGYPSAPVPLPCAR